MITFPNAKINLGLYVERKREDGYHDLSTVFYPIPLTDAVEVVEAKETALFTYGNPVDCPPEKNLVMKAYRLMEEEFLHCYLLRYGVVGVAKPRGSLQLALQAHILHF